MAHGNKTMPLDRYPYMDNDLKSRESGYVTHEELERVVNDLNTTIEEIENKLLVKTKVIELTNMGDFELIDSIYSEYGNVVFIGMKVKLLSDFGIDHLKNIGTIDYQSGYKKPLSMVGWNGVSTTGQLLMNSGTLQIRNITTKILTTGTEITFSLTYIGEDVE